MSFSVTRNKDRVEAQRQVVPAKALRDKVQRSDLQTLELSGRERFGGCSVAPATALPHLDDNREIVLRGDKIDFSAAHGVVFCQDRVATRFQVALGNLFSPVTQRLARQRRGRDRQRFRVGPETLEVVKLARLGAHHVNHNKTVVDQRPAG